MTYSSSNVHGGNAYIGIPVTQDADYSSGSSTNVKAGSSEGQTCYYWHGILALILGALLAAFFWASSQVCTIASVLLFGLPTWTVESVLKYLFFLTFGYAWTAIASFAVLKMCFPDFGLFDDEDNDANDDIEDIMCEKDIRRALEHLAELGFMVGLVVWELSFANILYKPFGMRFESRPGFDVALMVNILLWVLCIKAENLHRAMKRTSNLRRIRNTVEHADYAYVQIV